MSVTSAVVKKEPAQRTQKRKEMAPPAVQVPSRRKPKRPHRVLSKSVAKPAPKRKTRHHRQNKGRKEHSPHPLASGIEIEYTDVEGEAKGVL